MPGIIQNKSAKRILNSGLSNVPEVEHIIVQLYSILSLLCALGAAGLAIAAHLYDYSINYQIAISCIGLMYGSVVVSNLLGHYVLGRYIVVFGSTIWISGVYLILGGYYSQSAGFIAMISITYVTFQYQQKTRNRILAFQFLIYFSILLYVARYGSLTATSDLMYDEIVVLLGSIGWSLIMVYKFSRDREKLLAELKENNQELQDTTEELERFTYIASHDLKSPLRTIINFIGLIEKDIEAERYDGLEKKLSFVKSGAQQMNYLVQDILELSLLKGDSEEKHEWIHLDSALSKALTNLTDTIQKNNAIVTHDSLPKYYGNEMEFLLLFQNIIENGIKYNKSKEPKVSISHHTTEDNLFILIKDNGIGIEEKYYDTIFKFFKRLHNSNDYAGTGLGLGLCNKIVKNYKGVLSVSSKVGKGSEFKIILPLIDEERLPTYGTYDSPTSE